MSEEAEVPAIAERAASIPGSIYSDLAARVAATGREVFPFHVGDTWLGPPEGCAVAEDGEGRPAGTNRYTPVQGWAPLLDAARAREEAASGVVVDPAGAFICAGATAGLAALALATVNPGDEVVICAPVWPLVANMVRLAGGTPVFVDTLGRTDDPAALVAALEASVTPRTVAVYVNTPNNPVGVVLGADVLAAVAAFARAHRLWVWSDEVYADLQFSGAHVAMRRFAPERTVAIHSASKAFGMAGYRVGWLLGPPEIVREATKVSTYTYYCASYPGQVAARAALGASGARWQASAREAYAAIGGEVAAALGVPAPAGGTFLFLDVGAQIDALGGLPALLFRLASEGVLVAPGSSFGPYPRHLRLCFTAAAPEVTRRGVEALTRVLASVTGGG